MEGSKRKRGISLAHQIGVRRINTNSSENYSQGNLIAYTDSFSNLDNHTQYIYRQSRSSSAPKPQIVFTYSDSKSNAVVNKSK